MKYPKECPAFKVLAYTFTSGEVRLSNEVVVGAGLEDRVRIYGSHGINPPPEITPDYLVCHRIIKEESFELNDTWCFRKDLLKPLTESAEEMLSWVKP